VTKVKVTLSVVRSWWLRSRPWWPGSSSTQPIENWPKKPQGAAL